MSLAIVTPTPMADRPTKELLTSAQSAYDIWKITDSIPSMQLYDAILKELAARGLGYIPRKVR